MNVSPRHRLCAQKHGKSDKTVNPDDADLDGDSIGKSQDDGSKSLFQEIGVLGSTVQH